MFHGIFCVIPQNSDVFSFDSPVKADIDFGEVLHHSAVTLCGILGNFPFYLRTKTWDVI
jgi:hypothetical protein